MSDEEKTYTPPPITGYRGLSETEVTTINNIKGVANAVGTLVQAVIQDESTDKRWCKLAADNLQTGFMQLIRAITKPDSF